jgi:hypothetical protein
MILLLLTALAILIPTQRAGGQVDPVQGPLRILIEEPVVERSTPNIGIRIGTVGVYGCSDLTIATRQRFAKDTIGITILALNRADICSPAVGPAHAYVPLTLPQGDYVVAITRNRSTDLLRLRVSATRLALSAIGALAFVQPDTTILLRPAERSFLVSCGTPDVPSLCADIREWIARQPGIHHHPLAATDRSGFPRYGGYWHNDYQLFEYEREAVLNPLIRCMRQLADTLAQTVGAGIVLQTTNGQVLRAWSGRANHERHIPVPLRISGSAGCPAS